jgi:hypothetical protein
MTVQQAAKQIVSDLNDRSGVCIDFDEDIMRGIYQEIEDTINSIRTNANGGLLNE